MPLIEVHLIENVFNREQKRRIIQKADRCHGVERRREQARRDLGEIFRSHERLVGHRRPAADRSRQGSCSRTKGGVRPFAVWLPGGSSPHL